MVGFGDVQVKAVKFRTAFGVLLPKVLKGAMKQKSHCYLNTLKLINHYYYAANIEYVEGFIISKADNKTELHVWQKYDGKYFDITLENSQHRDPKDYSYYPLVEGTVDNLRAQGYTLGECWMPLTEQIIPSNTFE
jgi:hypothetical protein